MFKDKDKIPRRVQFKWIEGDPASVDAMRSAGLELAHALIIGGSTSAAPKEADAYTLTTITLAQARLQPAASPQWRSLACADCHGKVTTDHDVQRIAAFGCFDDMSRDSLNPNQM